MTRLSLRSLLQGAGEGPVRDCVFRWCGAADANDKPTLAKAAAAMEDEPRVAARIGALPRKLQDLLEVFFADEGAIRSVQVLFGECGKHFKSRFDLEAALAALQREGFVWHVRDKRWANLDSPCWAVPGEMVETVRQSRQKRQRQLQDTLTLQGFLDARFFRERAEQSGAGSGNGKAGKAAEQKAGDHARKIYKLYTMESAMAQRLGKLPAPVRTLVDAALHTHGGIASIDDLLRETDLADAPDLALVGKCLEEAIL
jgi:hypothetical protein